jgi:hypothetical protein
MPRFEQEIDEARAACAVSVCLARRHELAKAEQLFELIDDDEHVRIARQTRLPTVSIMPSLLMQRRPITSSSGRPTA